MAGSARAEGSKFDKRRPALKAAPEDKPTPHQGFNAGTSKSVRFRMERFARCFNGSIEDTVKILKKDHGIKISLTTAVRYLRDPIVAEIIAELAAKEEDFAKSLGLQGRDHVATRAERQKFLTETMNNGAVERKDRMRACELLGRMAGDFIERKDINSDRLCASSSGCQSGCFAYQ